MQTVLIIISTLLTVSVFISLIRNDYWVFKVMEYPRMQKLIIILLVVGFWTYYFPLEGWAPIVSFSLLCISVVYLMYKIIPYTQLSKREMRSTREMDPENSFSIFSANVLQDNRQYDKMLEQIRSTDPDIVFLLETDEGWAQAMNVLKETYSYHLLEPIDNTYGLLFFSRYKMEKGAVKYLVKNDIPSIEAVIQLPSGEKVQLWGVHPEPPLPTESLYATAKDKELMKVAFKARACKIPCIVLGDLNDVAWSHTTELFRKTSELLDPRRGRGFYNTFSAHHWFIRFPLDYIFCSKEFRLAGMKRLPKNGSDHFATWTHIILCKQKRDQDTPQADSDELQEAAELAQQEVKD